LQVADDYIFSYQDDYIFSYQNVKNHKIIMDKNFKLHIIPLLIISTYYLSSLLIFNAVVINPLDTLDISSVYNHVISRIINGDLESYKMFLAGEFKWYYLDKIFYPINIFHLIFNDKQFYFFEDISFKIIAYFSFYLFSKFFFNYKKYSILGALLYTNLIHSAMNSTSPTIFLSFMPYILYLAIIRKNIKIKHLMITFLIGLNSSLVFDYMSLILILFFGYLAKENKNNKSFIFITITISIGMIISAIPVILSILGEPTHRVLFLKANLLSFFVNDIKSFLGNFAINDIEKFFSLPTNLIKVFILISFLFVKNKKIYFFLIFLFFTFVLKNILSSDYSQIFFNNFIISLKGLNFSRIANIIPFLYCILLVAILNFSKNLFYNKLLKIFTIISSISLQIYFPLTEFTKEILKENIQEEYLINIKKDYINKNIKNVITIIFNKNNYNFEKINFDVKANTSFDVYYKIDTYKKIKQLVGDSKVASIGIDPMIAPMNNINAIDGYHLIYPLSYKKKFRKIIEDELNQNKIFSDYFDNWGNRVYMFFNDKNNLLLNFIEAKNIGATYIISAFSIKSINLELICPNCFGNNEIFLYKIL